MTGFSKNSLRLTTLIIACTLLGTDGSARVMASRASWDADLSAQAVHARELLGKSYDRSAANLGGSGAELGRFVFERTRELLPESSKPVAAAVARAILDESRRHGLDPVFTMSVIAHESRFDPTIIGSAGEIGLMQIKPDTASWVLAKAGLKSQTKAPLRRMLADPAFNIRVGTIYLAQLRKRFGSHGSYYLAAYNMGTRKLIHAVHARGIPHHYATSVMRHYLDFYGRYRTETARKTASSGMGLAGPVSF